MLVKATKEKRKTATKKNEAKNKMITMINETDKKKDGGNQR
jgi:hypothetical protein